MFDTYQTVFCSLFYLSRIINKSAKLMVREYTILKFTTNYSKGRRKNGGWKGDTAASPLSEKKISREFFINLIANGKNYQKLSCLINND